MYNILKKESDIMTDLEIARSVTSKDITKVADALGIKDYIETYGKDKAKLSLELLNKKNDKNKLILVTAINPTPMGEGKTTVSISLSDALNKQGKKSILAPERTISRTSIRYKRRSCWWRVCPSNTNGRYKPTFYWRLSRHNIRK